MQCRKCKAQIPDDAVFCQYCGAKQQGEQKRVRRRANGFGTVYKMSGRRRRPWAAVKDKVWIGNYETKTAALEALGKLVVDPVADRYNLTFAEVFKLWKAEHYQDVGEAGAEQYDNAYEVFADLHSRKFRDLHTSDFQEVIDRHSSKSVSTVSKYKQLLTQMSEWAIRERIIQTNFAHYVKAKGRASVGREPMNDEEIALIFKAAETDETAKIVAMLLATGMRIGELFQLPAADYYGDYVIGGEKTEEGRNRIIPIRKEGRPFFEYFAQHTTGEKLLDGYVGNKSPDNFRKRDYYPLLDKLGIDRTKTPRSTRTTYGTRAVAEDLPPAVLQKVLGHREFSTTQKYYNKPNADALVSAVEKARISSISEKAE